MMQGWGVHTDRWGEGLERAGWGKVIKHLITPIKQTFRLIWVVGLKKPGIVDMSHFKFMIGVRKPFDNDVLRKDHQSN